MAAHACGAPASWANGGGTAVEQGNGGLWVQGHPVRLLHMDTARRPDSSGVPKAPEAGHRHCGLEHKGEGELLTALMFEIYAVNSYNNT